jgi:DMSO/TMAO reductase YedYZ molybdopterin-dependent catalytic subunit
MSGTYVTDKANPNLYYLFMEGWMMKRKNLILAICSVAMIFSVIYLVSCQTVAQEATQTTTTTTTTWYMGDDIEDYRLIVNGKVNNPLELTYEALLEYPAVSQKVLLICPGSFEETREWTGVPMSVLLAEVDPKPGAGEVVFYAADGYSSKLSLREAKQDGVFLAYGVEGKTLPAEDGYPLRLVIKDVDGNYWVRWIVRIEIV